MVSFSVVFAEKASTVAVATSGTVVVAVTRRLGGDRTTVVRSSSSGIAFESWKTSFTLVSFGVVLAVETVAIFLIAGRSMSVTFASLAKSQVESTSGSSVARGTIFTTGSNVAWRTRALFDFGGLSSLAVGFRVLQGDLDETRAGTVVIVAELDQDVIQISQSHEQMFSGCRLSIGSFPFIFGDWDFDDIFSVCLKLTSVSVLKGDFISSDDDIGVRVKASTSRILEGVFKRSSVTGNFVAKELLRQFPVQCLSLRFLEVGKVDSSVVEIWLRCRAEAGSRISNSDFKLILISSSVVDLYSGSSVVGGSALVCDSHAEAFVATLGRLRVVVEGLSSTLVAVWSSQVWLALTTAIVSSYRRNGSRRTSSLWRRCLTDRNTSAQVWSMAGSFIAWSAIFAAETNIARWARTLFYFKGQAFLGISVNSNLPRNIAKAKN